MLIVFLELKLKVSSFPRSSNPGCVMKDKSSSPTILFIPSTKTTCLTTVHEDTLVWPDSWSFSKSHEKKSPFLELFFKQPVFTFHQKLFVGAFYFQCDAYHTWNYHVKGAETCTWHETNLWKIMTVKCSIYYFDIVVSSERWTSSFGIQNIPDLLPEDVDGSFREWCRNDWCCAPDFHAGFPGNISILGTQHQITQTSSRFSKV